MAPPTLFDNDDGTPVLPWRGHPLFTLENIHAAYRNCRRGKRGTQDALEFEKDLESNLVALRDELEAGTYRPGPPLAFMVEKPKLREIFAACFRDRVVHHVLVGALEPVWERRFIHDSCACREGKGTHMAVGRLQQFARQITRNETVPAWYLQLDVKGFFTTLNRRILFERLKAEITDPAVLWLLREILFHDLTSTCRFRRAKREDFNVLPPHKTLFKAAPDCGLPIGNLTSQFFANVYLDALDQFAKHELKAKHYVRYCDDFVLLSDRREQLVEWETKIAGFLETDLQLQLNERRRLLPIANGIDFLGYIVRPSHLLTRRRVIGNLREKLTAAESELTRLGLRRDEPSGRTVYPWPHALLRQVKATMDSYLAHFKRAASRDLIESIRERFWWLAEYFKHDEGRFEWRYRAPRYATRLPDQKRWYVALMPDHFIVLQWGNRWELIPPGEREGVVLHVNEVREAKGELWKSPHPVAWVMESGKVLSRIVERILVRRWEKRAA